MSVDILMAVYNSGEYINEQIDSIINQNSHDWRLIIRDDGSSDGTPEKIKKYAEKYPGRIKLYHAPINAGAKENFNKLLELAESEYIMFADHDDFWLPDKIAVTKAKMEELEKKYGKNTPLLVFTDKSITDENLNILYASSAKAEKFDIKNITPNRLLVQNVASGCTMMINRNLLSLCGNIPKEAVMHDHYFMLLASVFGQIGYEETPTMLYRQHEVNVLGARPCDYKYFFAKLAEKPGKIKERFMKNVIQGKIILEKYNGSIPKDKKNILEEFVKLEEAGRLEFAGIIIRNKFYKSGALRKIGMLALLI